MGCASSVPSSPFASASRSESKSISVVHPHHGLENWQVSKKIGEGAFADVYAVRHTSSRRRAALKISRFECCNDRQVNEEGKLWQSVGQHEHIVNLLHHSVIDGLSVLLMERCNSTLSERMHDMPAASEDTLVCMFREMASALEHLELKKIVHRDVKPDNFLCVDDQLKLCDFGLASLIPESGELRGTFGTPHFMSPEMIGDGPHNLKTDVWSLGATCYKIVYGEPPYTTNPANAERVMQAIATGFPAPRYQGKDHVSSMTKTTVMTLLHRPMSSRLSAAEVLQLSCFNMGLEKPSEIPKFFSEASTRATGSEGIDSISICGCSSSLAGVLSSRLSEGAFMHKLSL